MATIAMRFDMRCPEISPATPGDLYRTALEQAAWADERGVDALVLSEHHGVEDGYLPSPLVMAAAIAGRTQRAQVSISALIAPLHDPLRLAEDIAVLDLLSGGRASLVIGVGYRPEEFEMFDVPWSKRGKVLDASLETMLKAWTGEPFEYQGRTVRVTPRPLSQPHPIVFVGGSTPVAARRAARFDLGFFPAIGDTALRDVYVEECEKLGKPPGFVLLPKGPGFVHLAEDPDKAWAEIGEYLLYEAKQYASWQQPGQRSQVADYAGTVDELRNGDVYRVLTPEQCLAMVEDLGSEGSLIFHPLIGGMPPELSWPSLELLASKVLPALGKGGG
jgi:alkanesulfonate monooxygenase SsuD/methylene tetrahydromethanopterin reductase-like flavin-dependent oxidoreductase (luciferase family)